jgi:hypothetical protein
MQASERLSRCRPQPLRDEAPRRSLEGECREGVTIGPGLDPDLGGEALLEVVPAEPERGLNHSDDDLPFAAGSPQEARRTATRNLPAGSLGEASPVGPNRRVLGPPVGQVVWLGKERPDILWSCDQLSLRLDSHRA